MRLRPLLHDALEREGLLGRRCQRVNRPIDLVLRRVELARLTRGQHVGVGRQDRGHIHLVRRGVTRILHADFECGRSPGIVHLRPADRHLQLRPSHDDCFDSRGLQVAVGRSLGLDRDVSGLPGGQFDFHRLACTGGERAQAMRRRRAFARIDRQQVQHHPFGVARARVHDRQLINLLLPVGHVRRTGNRHLQLGLLYFDHGLRTGGRAGPTDAQFERLAFLRHDLQRQLLPAVRRQGGNLPLVAFGRLGARRADRGLRGRHLRPGGTST